MGLGNGPHSDHEKRGLLGGCRFGAEPGAAILCVVMSCAEYKRQESLLQANDQAVRASVSARTSMYTYNRKYS